MVFTLSTRRKGYFTNEFFWKNLGKNRILVTTRHGGWTILNEEEFKLLRHGKCEENIELYNKLKQEGIIISEDNVTTISDCYKEKFSQLFLATTLHIITPTLRCNHKCIYCYASSKPLKAKEYDMDKDIARATVDFIFQCPSKGITIEFQGGEPLLNFEIVKFIVNYARKKAKEKNKDVNFRIVTNLTLMNNSILKWLVKNKVDINTSLDGPEFVHNTNRKYENGKGSYKDVVKWIKILKKKKIPIGVMPTITRYSLPYWKEIIEEYRKLGIMRFWARRLNVGGFAVKKWKEIGYNPKEYLNFWKKCLNYILKLNEKGIRMQEVTTEIFLRNVIFSKNYNSFVCLASPCGCAWSQLSYTPSGDVYTCDESRSFEIFKLGNVKETNYEQLFSSWKVLDIVALTSGLSFDCSSCVYHPFCGPCIVDEYGEHGNIIKKPNSFNCQVKKGIFDYIFKEIIPNKKKFEIVKTWIGISREEHAGV